MLVGLLTALRGGCCWWCWCGSPVGGAGANRHAAVEKHTRQQEPQLPCSDGIGVIGSGGDAFEGQCEGLADPTTDELWRGLEEGASGLQCGWEVYVVQAGQCCA